MRPGNRDTGIGNGPVAKGRRNHEANSAPPRCPQVMSMREVTSWILCCFRFKERRFFLSAPFRRRHSHPAKELSREDVSPPSPLRTQSTASNTRLLPVKAKYNPNTYSKCPPLPPQHTPDLIFPHARDFLSLLSFREVMAAFVWSDPSNSITVRSDPPEIEPPPHPTPPLPVPPCKPVKVVSSHLENERRGASYASRKRSLGGL